MPTYLSTNKAAGLLHKTTTIQVISYLAYQQFQLEALALITHVGMYSLCFIYHAHQALVSQVLYISSYGREKVCL